MPAQVPIYNLRSGTANKRPVSSGLAYGQIALNYNQADPAIYFRGSSDDVIKVGPVYIGTGVPNAVPASGGASGNTVGEQWLDTTNGDYLLKTWDGTGWRSDVITSAQIKNGTIVDADISASAAIAFSKLATGALPSGITISSTNIVDGSITNADINASAAIALSKLDTGALPSGITVASSNIVDGTIVDADINASAAIVDTKLATISTAGKVSGNAVTSGTIGGSTAINTTGNIATTGVMAVGQSSVAANTDFDLNGTFAQTVRTVSALDIDCSVGNYFIKTINSNSTFTFSNVPSSRAYSFILELTHDGGTITWPVAVKWPADTAPTLTTGKTHLFMFVTDDNGSRWRGASLVNYVN